MPEDLGHLLKRLKAGWNLVAAFATWLVSVISGIVLPPPPGVTQLGQGARILKLTEVVTAVLVALLAVPLIRWSAKRYTWLWWRSAAGALVLAVSACFAYEWFATNWTCIYAGRVVVIGSMLTPHGKDFIDKNPSRTTPEDWIMSHAGKVDEIWTRDSIERHCVLLACLYLLTLPLFATTIICSMQAVHCNSRLR